jgi:hypothetical protein
MSWILRASRVVRSTVLHLMNTVYVAREEQEIAWTTVMETGRAQKIAIMAGVAAVLAAFATGRLPRWLRITLVSSLAGLACAAGLRVSLCHASRHAYGRYRFD